MAKPEYVIPFLQPRVTVQLPGAPAHAPVRSGQGEGKRRIASMYVCIKLPSLLTNSTAKDVPQQGDLSRGPPRLPGPTAARGLAILEADHRTGYFSLPPTASAVYSAPFTLQTCRENFPPSHFPVRAVKLNPALICQKHFSADIFNKYFQLLNTFVGAIFSPFSPFSSCRMGSESLNSKYITLIKGFPPLFLLHPEAEVVFSILKLN